MADFETQIEGITGLSIDGSSSPTQNEITEYLKDGVIDVTSRCIQLKPQEAFFFERESSESTSQGGLKNSDGDIISVVRESGTDADWRPCQQGSISLQSRYADTNSLFFVSKYNPAYAIGGDGSILVFPAPSAGGTNSYKVYYVNATPVNTSDVSLIYSHSDINYFPKDKVYLVVLYASIKSLYNKMSSIHSNTGISTALSAITTALGSANTRIATAKSEIDLAKTEAAEIASQTDNSGDFETACDAMKTELDKVDNVIVLASTEFDKTPAQIVLASAEFDQSDALLSRGETDSEGAVNTAAAKIITEMDETQTVCDKLDTDLVLAKAEIVLAKAEAAELASNTDNSSDFETACDAMVTELNKVDNVITEANTEFDKVDEVIAEGSTEFDEAKNLSAAYNSGAIATALDAIQANVDLANSVFDTPPVPPDVPALTTVSFSSLDSDLDADLPTYTTAVVEASSVYTGSAPNYSKLGTRMGSELITVVSGVTAFSAYTSGLNEADPGVLNITAVPPEVPNLGSSSVTITGTAPTYTAPTTTGTTELTVMDTVSGEETPFGTDVHFDDFGKWFQTAAELIEDEEDTELAAAQLQKISTYIQSYSAAMQNQLNIFNDANIEYQAILKKDLQDADFDNQEDERLINKYTAEIQEYTVEVQAEVQEYTQKLAQYQLELNTAYTAWAKTETDRISAIQLDIQDELNDINTQNTLYGSAVQESIQNIQVSNQVEIAKAEAELRLNMDNENRSQQRILQNGINDMKAINDNNAQLINKYNVELQGYQAEIGSMTAQAGGYIQTSQGYVQEVQSYSVAGQTFIATGSAYIMEANAIVSQGNAYIAEANTYIAQAKGYASEVNARSTFAGAKSQAIQGYIGTAQSYIQTAAGFGSEVQSKINIANGYAAEISIRLAQAKSKREESGQRLAAGSAYIQESGATIASGDAYLKEAQSIVAQAQGYANEVQARTGFTGAKSQAVQAYISTANAYLAEVAQDLSLAQGYSVETQTRMADLGQEYQWYDARYKELKAEYDQAFAIMAPPPPQQPQA